MFFFGTLIQKAIQRGGGGWRLSAGVRRAAWFSLDVWDERRHEGNSAHEDTISQYTQDKTAQELIACGEAIGRLSDKWLVRLDLLHLGRYILVPSSTTSYVGVLSTADVPMRPRCALSCLRTTLCSMPSGIQTSGPLTLDLRTRRRQHELR